MTFDAKSVAQKLLSARKTRSQLQATDVDQEATTLSEAFAVHSLVMAELGAVGAFKTSKTPEGGQILAPIPANDVRPDGATFTGDELVQIGIELEIAFRLERELPALDDPDFADKLKAAVVAYPVIEVVDTRLAFLDTCHPMMKLADNQSNAGLVYGEPVADWQSLNLTNPGHEFTAADQLVSEGPGAVPGGSAFEILEGFVRVAGDHCGGFQVGQFLTTGALSGLHWIEKGQTVQGEIDGLGSVEVVIGA